MCPTTLTCRDFVALLAEYLDAALPPDALAAFNAHLARCPSCVSYTHTYQESLRLGRAALRTSGEPLPDEVPDDLVRAILAVAAGGP